MADIWPLAEDRPVEAAAPKPSTASSHLARIVRDSLRRELEARHDRVPHAQLAVDIGADQPTIHRAFLRLRTHFDPQPYSTHGPEAVALAQEILALVEAAYLLLSTPSADSGHSLAPLASNRRSDETLRALETLRGSVASRKSEALKLLATGRIADARHMFEAVLRLDPHDERAQAELHRLVPHRKTWSFIFAAAQWLRALFRRLVGLV